MSNLIPIDRNSFEKAINTDEIKQVQQERLRRWYIRNWVIMIAAMAFLVSSLVVLLVLIL